GLTEALRLCERARESGFRLLIGCMVCTSLGIAPARVAASFATWSDLDGPLLLARDRDHPVPYANGKIGVPSRELWGCPAVRIFESLRLGATRTHCGQLPSL